MTGSVPLPAWCHRHREIMPAEAAPFALDLLARLQAHNPRWEATDSGGYWGEGVPLGNGDFGAMLYGAPDNLTLVLGKNDLWIRSTTRSCFPDGVTYADLLRIYRSGDREAFDRLLPHAPHWEDHFHPSTLTNAGVFRLHLAEAASIDGFTRELSLYDATWHGSFSTFGLDNMWPETPEFELLAFASSPHEVLVLRARRARLPLRSFTWRLDRERHDLLPPPRTGTDGDIAWLTQDLLQDDRYAVAALQVGASAVLTTGQRSVLGECDGEAQEVTFYLAAASQRDSADPRGLACERVTRAVEAGLEAVHATHISYWADLWGRSWVTCADAAVERPWYVANYLCGSTLRPGKVSPGLQGMWAKENRPAWNADFHGNVNIQAIYHGLFGSNRLELFEPYARLYHEMLPQCQRDTLDFFGVDGARFPHAGAIDGFELCDPAWPTLAVSLAPSMWIARLFWWMYQHTLDRDFLAEIGYPILREVARYYLGLLHLAGRGADGRWRVEPSIWGEAHATSFDGWGTDSSYDVAAMLAAFQQAADAAKALGIDADDVAAWRQVMAELPELPVDADGAWLAWPQHAKNFRVGAGSFFHPVYPCELASAFHGPEILRAQAHTSWVYAREASHRAWCAGAPTAAAARMGDAEWAFRSASEYTRTGIGGNPDRGMIQADHGTGMALALNSMLLLGIDGALIFFPGMPAGQDAAFHSLRAPGAVLASAEQRDGKVTHVAVQALCKSTLRVLNPFDPAAYGTGSTVPVCVDDGTGIVWQADARYREALQWQAKAGVVYRLSVNAKETS